MEHNNTGVTKASLPKRGLAIAALATSGALLALRGFPDDSPKLKVAPVSVNASVNAASSASTPERKLLAQTKLHKGQMQKRQMQAQLQKRQMQAQLPSHERPEEQIPLPSEAFARKPSGRIVAQVFARHMKPSRSRGYGGKRKRLNKGVRGVPGGIPGDVAEGVLGVPGGIPGRVAEAIPGGVPGGIPGRVAEAIPGGVAEAIPADVAEAIPGGVPGGIPGSVAEAIPGDVPGGIPGGVAAGVGGRAVPGGVNGSLDMSRVGQVHAGTGQRHRGGEEAPVAEAMVPIQETKFATIATDVDTASYARMRRRVLQGARVDPGSVRLEEFINYFNYPSTTPSDDESLTLHSELGPSPWNPARKLLRVQVSAHAPQRAIAPARSLVFLIDVSGSMAGDQGLELLRDGLGELVQTLRAQDKVSIITYAGSTQEVLAPTSGKDQAKILRALQALEVGGSTNGGQGISLAYRRATESFVEGGINRVVLATDGDFNVGTTDTDELVKLVESQRDKGVYLSILGVFGSPYDDRRMEQMADHGNGNYAFLDSRQEAKRVLLHEANQTLNAIADDVKIQVEFNPNKVKAHRILGYENRRLAKRDFMDAQKDAGDMGDGQSVTALYEVELQDEVEPKDASPYAKLSVRYRPVGQAKATMLHHAEHTLTQTLDDNSDDFRFAIAVARFGMLLRQSSHTSDELAQVHRLALDARGEDHNCKRAEFVNLVRQQALNERSTGSAVNWAKVRCEASWEPRPRVTAAKRFTPVIYTSDSEGISPLGALADLLEWLASLVRGLPAWTSFVPAAIGLGFWIDQARDRRRPRV